MASDGGGPAVDDARQRLSLFQGKPIPNINQHATVLIVGGVEHHRRTLATALCDNKTNDITIFARLSETLPLPPTKDGSERPRIDFVVFVADMSSRASFSHFFGLVQAVSPEYFAGHACLVLHQGHASAEAVTSEELEEVGDFGIPILPVALGSPRAVAIVRDRIVQAVKIACRHVRGGITPLVVESLNMELCYQMGQDGDDTSVVSEDAQ